MFGPDHVPPAGVPVNVTGAWLLQRFISGPALTIGNGFTVTVTVADLKQPVEVVVPVTVYVVVAAGFAVTTAPVVLLKPVAGDQR